MQALQNNMELTSARFSVVQCSQGLCFFIMCSYEKGDYSSELISIQP